MADITRTNIDKAIDRLLFEFSPNQRKVLKGRFGLGGKRQTLQEIGDELGVTRERIRQIENQGIQKLKPRVNEDLEWLLERAASFLKEVGGVRRDDYFVRDIQHVCGIDNTRDIAHKLRFVFLVGGTPHFHKEDTEIENFWYVDEKAKQELMRFLDNTLSFFKKRDKKELLEDKVYLDELGDLIKHHYIAISKQFDTNVFGEFGLKSWPEIQPKVVRDKAYLVLKKQERPLHFEDIARLITELGIDEKPAHTQTVHNELIKDSRFMLVGRGMYGLKEHGFEGGTVREVIRRVLEEFGPLPAEDVLKSVGERKILKENTILLNLQNRRYFERLKDGRYALRKK